MGTPMVIIIDIIIPPFMFWAYGYIYIYGMVAWPPASWMGPSTLCSVGFPLCMPRDVGITPYIYIYIYIYALSLKDVLMYTYAGMAIESRGVHMYTPST